MGNNGDRMTFDRHHIAARIRACGITLRAWQRQALILATAADCPDLSLIVAIMGAGKSVVLSLLAASWSGPVVVSVPSVKLVRDMVPILRRLTGEPIGAWYTDEKRRERITVVCVPSLTAYAAAHGHIPDLLWIADEAHKCETDNVAAFRATCQPARSIGVTATPYRADAGLSLWQHVLMHYTMDAAVSDGALVPFRVEYPTGRGLTEVDDLVIEWVRRGEGACVISAADIADCDAFALACSDAGLRVAALHSRNRKGHESALAALQRGDLQAIVHCHMLSEGVDLPFLRRLALRHPRGSRVEYAQEIGRVLRVFEGKTVALVFDPWQVTLTHSLATAAELATALECDAEKEASDDTPPPLAIDPLTGEPFVWEDLPAPEKKRVMLATAAVAYVGSCVVAWRNAGLVSGRGQKGRWRTDPASEAQLRALDNLSRTIGFARSRGYRLPGSNADTVDHVRAVCRAYDRTFRGAPDRTRLRKGPCSDLLSAVILLISGRPSRDFQLPEGVTDTEYWTRATALTTLTTYAVDPTPLLD